jgi:predicted PurR-regulated permease PerM
MSTATNQAREAGPSAGDAELPAAAAAAAAPERELLPHWTASDVARATLTVVAVAGIFVLLFVFRAVLFLLLIGIVLSIALSPLVAWLQRRGLSRASASVLVYLAISVGAGALAVVGLPLLVKQGESMAGQIPDAYRQFHRGLLEAPSELVRRFAQHLPHDLADLAPRAARSAQAIDTVAQGISYGRVAIEGLFIVLATMLLAFYWSVHEERTIRSALLFVPVTRRDAARELVSQMAAKVGAYLRAQGTLCLIMAVMVLIAYWLIGVPYVLTLAITAGVLEAVPVFGPVLGAIPALLVALSVSTSQALWVLGAVTLIQQFESNLLVPRLMDRSVGVNAIVTLLAIAGFTTLLGLAGAVLAIPMAAIIQLLLDRWLLSAEALEPPQPAGRDAVSLLRYQARQLVHDVRLTSRAKESAATRRSDRLEDAIESLARDLDEQLSAVPKPVINSAAAAIVGSIVESTP